MKGVVLALGVVLVLEVSPLLYAQEPSQPEFKLVPFNRSIAAPVFELEDLVGNVVRLEQFKGRIVLLNFWATWCRPCVKEMSSMEQLHQHFKDKPFSVIAISLDEEPKEVVAAFTQRLNLTFTILHDPKSVVSGLYGAKALPSSFILDSEGQIISAAKGELDWYSEDAISTMDDLLQE